MLWYWFTGLCKKLVVEGLTHLFAGIATAAIQQGNSTGTGDWITITSGSQTINGVLTTWIKYTEIMYGARYRFRVIRQVRKQQRSMRMRFLKSSSFFFV